MQSTPLRNYNIWVINKNDNNEFAYLIITIIKLKFIKIQSKTMYI